LFYKPCILQNNFKIYRCEYLKKNTFVRYIQYKTLVSLMRKTVLILLSLFIVTLLAAQNTVTDIDGNNYKTVVIGTQEWMAANLNTTKYNDGTAIPNETDNTAWINLTTGAYCNYNNLVSNAATYGRLYNWYSTNTGKLCPTGWHVPSDAEWTNLQNYLIANGYNYDGTTIDNKIAKSMASTTGWNSSPITGTVGNNSSTNNKSAFTALSGGARYNNGTFSDIGIYGYWWNSSEYLTSAIDRYLFFYSNYLFNRVDSKVSGFSVRCLRDVDPLGYLSISLKAASSAVCSGSLDTLKVQVCSGTAPYCYKWSIGTVTSVPILTVTPTVNSNYIVTVTDAKGKTNRDSIFIMVNQPTTSTTNATICQGESYSFNGNTYSTAGTYIAHLTNSVGCDSVAKLILTVKQPSSSIQTVNACFNFTFHGTTYYDSGTYIFHDTNAVGCDSTITLHLIINKASYSTSYATICKGNHYTFNGTDYSNAGTYETHLTNVAGCDSTATLHLGIIDVPFIQLPKDSIYCDNVHLPIILTDTSASYKWQDYSSSPNYTITKAGIYSVTATNGCGMVTDSIKIGVVSSPTIKLPTDTLLCIGKPLLVNVSSPGTNKYLWQDYSTNPKYTVSKAGTYSVSVTDTNNCSASKAMNVHELASPAFLFPNDTIACNEILLPINISCAECTYLWNDGSVASKYIIQNEGEYSVTVSNNCGTVKDSIHVKINDCTSFLDVPTAFSPNGDGLNDVLYAVGRNIEKLSFVIYDRWGQKMFESNSLADGWDGTFKGRTLESATFMYTISATGKNDGKVIVKKGTVALIR